MKKSVFPFKFLTWSYTVCFWFSGFTISCHQLFCLWVCEDSSQSRVHIEVLACSRPSESTLDSITHLFDVIIIFFPLVFLWGERRRVENMGFTWLKVAVYFHLCFCQTFRIIYNFWWNLPFFRFRPLYLVLSLRSFLIGHYNV